MSDGQFYTAFRALTSQRHGVKDPGYWDRSSDKRSHSASRWQVLLWKRLLSSKVERRGRRVEIMPSRITTNASGLCGDGRRVYSIRLVPPRTPYRFTYVYRHLRRLDNIGAIFRRLTSREVLRCSGGFNLTRRC